MTKTETKLLAQAAAQARGHVSVTVRYGRTTLGKSLQDAALSLVEKGFLKIVNRERSRSKGYGFYNEVTYVTHTLCLTDAGRTAAAL